MATCLQFLSVKEPSCPMRLRVRCPDDLGVGDHFPGDQKVHSLVAQADLSLENQTDRSPKGRKDHSFKGRTDDFMVDLEDHSGRVRLLDEAEAFLG